MKDELWFAEVADDHEPPRLHFLSLRPRLVASRPVPSLKT